MAAIEGQPDHRRYREVRQPTTRSVKSQVIADLPIGARGGLRHHRGTANE